MTRVTLIFTRHVPEVANLHLSEELLNFSEQIFENCLVIAELQNVEKIFFHVVLHFEINRKIHSDLCDSKT